MDDQKKYSELTRHLAVQYVASLAMQLHSEPLVRFDLTNFDMNCEELLFSLCLVGTGTFESRRGIRVEGTVFRPRIVFESSLSSGTSFLEGQSQVRHHITNLHLKEGVVLAQSAIAMPIDDSARI